MAIVAEELLTAEAYAQMPDPGYPTELVQGRIVEMGSPGFLHGKVTNRIGRLIGNFAEDHDLGHVLNNDSGVITERDPDSVRGPDVAFYSYARLPRETKTTSYPLVAPELVFEVLSPSDRWKNVLSKTNEYIQAGVMAVCVVDPGTGKGFFYLSDEAPLVLIGDDLWSVPTILPGFSIPVRRFFE